MRGEELKAQLEVQAPKGGGGPPSTEGGGAEGAVVVEVSWQRGRRISGQSYLLIH
jgi:hypothetical protein